MTISLTVSGSRKPTADSPDYHPLTDEEAKAFDDALSEFTAKLAAANLQGSVGGSRPHSKTDYQAAGSLGSKSISITF